MSIMFQWIIFLYLWLVFYSGPQLSRQKQIAHGNSLMVKANSLTAKANQLTAKANQLCYIFTQWSTPIFLIFYWQFYNLLKNFWFWHAFISSEHIDRDQKKPVSTILILNLGMKSPRSCVFSLLYLEIYNNSWSEGQWSKTWSYIVWLYIERRSLRLIGS